MKNRILTNSTRTIKKSFPRFLSLIIMSLLGVMVFVGLLATSPDMLNTIDNYYDEKNVYDIKILSSMGLIEDDITALKNIENIKEVEGIYSTDILLSSDDFFNVLNAIIGKGWVPMIRSGLELVISFFSFWDI